MTGEATTDEAFTQADKAYMKRALDLAALGAGQVSPNPLVGAVLVKDGRLIGEGWHRGYGGKHAEAEAIAAASEHPAGADLYCTLEPCCFTGPEKHQPPCTELIIRSGIARVFLANEDPNPKVSGEGIKRLREAGIEVRTGLLERQGEDLNEVFFSCMRQGRPFVHLRNRPDLGRPHRGRRGRQPLAITDAEARKRVHGLRAAYDVVLAGIGTVKADDPSFTVRDAEGRNPFRAVLDSELSISEDAKLLHLPDSEKTLVFMHLLGRRTHEAAEDRSPEGPGPHRPGKQIGRRRAQRRSWTNSLETQSPVRTRGRRSRSPSPPFSGKTLDKLSVYIAPLLVGKGIEAVGDLDIKRLRDALRLERVSIETIGDQVLVQGRRPLFREE